MKRDMTKYIGICNMIILLSICACSSPTGLIYERTGEVICLEYDDRKATFEAVGVGNTEEEARISSEIKTFENIFFKGIPDSSQERPMIPSENQNDRMDDFMRHFFNDGKHKEFVLDIALHEKQGSRGGYLVRQHLSLDMTALRSYLEDQNIIRKFGL